MGACGILALSERFIKGHLKYLIRYSWAIVALHSSSAL